MTDLIAGQRKAPDNNDKKVWVHFLCHAIVIQEILVRMNKKRQKFVFGYLDNSGLIMVLIITSCTLAEQITVRIVQIMIQATYFAQILYGVTFEEKNAGHAKFQYGRHFPRWPQWAIVKCYFLPQKWHWMVKKDYFDNRVCVLSMEIA